MVLGTLAELQIESNTMIWNAHGCGEDDGFLRTQLGNAVSQSGCNYSPGPGGQRLNMSRLVGRIMIA